MINRRENSLYRGEFFDILRCLFKKNSKNYVKEFEEKFAKYIGVKYAITTFSGRTALTLLLESLGLKKGDEIIFPAYTLKDLILIVKKLGFKPILVDIEEDSFNLNPELIEEKISDRTKVIVPTHMFGLPCNMKKIVKIAKKYDIYVIEDCCLAHGAELDEKKVGSFGTAGFFSFDQIKLIGTFGGGMITTNDKTIAEILREKVEKFEKNEKEILKRILFAYSENFLLKTPFFYPFSFLFYFNFTQKIFKKIYKNLRASKSFSFLKYTNLQAFVGLKQLEKLEEKIKKRNEIAGILRSLLKNVEFQSTHLKKYRHAYYYFVIKVNKNIEKIRRKLLLKGMDVGIKDEIEDDCTILLPEFVKDCSVAHKIFNSIIQIPFSERFSQKRINEIAKILNEVIR